MNERDLFMAALQLEDAAERLAYLDRVCAGDTAVRQRVEALLKAFEQAGSFLQQPEGAPGPTFDGSPPGPSSDSDPAVGPGTYIGPYKLLQQIGEGGMGVVWMAEQTHPVKRKVALKVIKPGMDSRQVIARFEAERQALALMDHVNIARVFDGGTVGSEQWAVSSGRKADASALPTAHCPLPTAEGRPYFVMELVHGVPITKYCDDNHLTPRERLELFVPVCQAIQHAHQKGIIHRDIKPSNVMVTLYDGKPVPKVIDFGVAKATEQKLTERTLFTQYGTMVGTLEYMSPEQAEMSALGVDTRSDIYSLGVLLYELLTGSTPLTHKRMKEAALGEILRMIKEEEPPRPSTRLSELSSPHAPREEPGLGSRSEPATLASIAAQRSMEPAKLTKLVRGELDWIVMKCLEKDRNRRYETANGFAADVQRYLADEHVLACPPSAGYRLRKFVRRNKRALAATALVGVLLLVSAVVATIFAFQADRSAKDAFLAGEEKKKEAARATQEAENATLARREAERVLGMQFVSNGIAAMDKGDLSTAAIWFAEAGHRDRSDPDRSQQHLLRLRSALRQCARPEHILFHDGDIWEVALSSDGSRLVTAGKSAQIWDAHTGVKLGPSLPHDAPIRQAKFSKDGRRLLTMTNQSRYGDPAGEQFVRVWDVASGRLLTPPIPHEGWGGPAFMLDDECVLTRSGPETLQLWHTETGKPAGAPFEHPANLDLRLACTPDGQFVAALTSPTMPGKAPKKDDPPNQLWLWNVRTRHSTTLPLTSRENHMGAEFSPDSSRLIYNDPSDVAIVLDVRTGKRVSTYHRPGAGELWHAFSSNGRHVFTWSLNRNLLAELWDMETGRAVGSHVEYHNDFDFGKAWRQIGYHAVLSPDGRRVLAPPPDEPTSRVVWDPFTGKRLGLPIKHETMIGGELFSPDGRLIVAASENGTVRTWKASRKNARLNNGYDFAPVGPPMLHDREVSHLRFSPDGRRLFTIAGSVVRIWPLAAELEPDARLEHPHPVTQVLRTSDGRRAVTVTQPTRQSFEIRIWDLTTGKLVGEPRRYADEQHSVNVGLTMSPDNRHILLTIGRFALKGGTGPGGGRELGDLETGRWQALSLNMKDPFNPQFSATGRYLLLTRPDGVKKEPGHEVAQRLYETAPCRDVSELLGSTDAVTVLGWSPDDCRVLLQVESAPSQAGGKGTVRGVQVWDLEKQQALTPLFQHEGARAMNPVFQRFGNMARFSQDGRVVLTEARVDEGAEARIWDAQTGNPLGPVVQVFPKREALQLEMMAELSPNGRRLLVAGMAYPRVLPVRIWDLITGASVELPGAIDMAWIGANADTNPRNFSADGRRVLAKTANGLRLFDGESGAPVTPELTPGPAYRQRDRLGMGLEISGQLSLDGSRVLTENPTQIWDAATAQAVTPPFPVGVKDIEKSFALRGNGDAVLIRERPNVLALYRLPSAGKSVEELAVLAETLGGRRLTASGTLQTLDARQLESGWKTLCAAEPAPLSGPAESLAWHRRWIELLDYHKPAGFFRGTGLGSLTNLYEWIRATKPIDMVERTDAFAARWHLDRLLAVERKPDLVAARGFANCVIGDWDRAVADFNEAMNGGVPHLVGPRGEALAELGRFDEACADFLRALPDKKDPLGLLMKLGYAQSAARDEAGLRQTRDQLRLHLNKLNPHDPQAVFLLWPLAFDPPRDPEFKLLLQKFEDVWMFRDGRPSFERANNLMAVGLARHRLGEYEAALSVLSVAEPLLIPENRLVTTLLLAMSCQKLDRPKVARAWFDKATKLPQPTDQHWIVRLVRERLRSEATELIGTQK